MAVADRARGDAVQSVRPRPLLRAEGAGAPRLRGAGGAALIARGSLASQLDRGRFGARRCSSCRTRSRRVARDEPVGGRARAGDFGRRRGALLVRVVASARRSRAPAARRARVGRRRSARSRRWRKRTACGPSTSVSTARRAARSATATSSRTCARSACRSSLLVTRDGAPRPATVVVGVLGCAARRPRRSSCLAAARRGSPSSSPAVPSFVAGAMSRGRWRGTRDSRRVSRSRRRRARRRGAAAIVLPNRLEWKSDTPYLDSAVGLVNYKEGSGHGRLVQYTNSLHMTEARSAARRRPGKLAGRLPEVRVAQRSVARAGRGHDGESVAEQRLGRVSVGAWRDRTRRSWSWSSSACCDARSGRAFARAPTASWRLRARADVDCARRHARGGLVVGSFDAVLIVAVPAFFVWTLAGALAPPSDRTVVARPWLRVVAMASTVVCGCFAVARSAAQLAAIATFSAELTHHGDRARRVGSTPVISNPSQAGRGVRRARRMRACQAGGARGSRVSPNAAEPKRVLGSCGGALGAGRLRCRRRPRLAAGRRKRRVPRLAALRDQVLRRRRLVVAAVTRHAVTFGVSFG